MQELRYRATNLLGQDYSEQKVCGDNGLAVDFFFPNESAILEVALSLRNSNTEFERDILKALMAQEAGHSVTRLQFLSKPGAISKHMQPSSRAIISWALRNHGLKVEIRELLAPGMPR